ncbi:MAG: hypothetical protein R3185_09265 [Candidatus Thermoplasmatota archaeon]|nr:hypothetical protein [Candidatus Thermoplasmatota archaeon]
MSEKSPTVEVLEEILEREEAAHGFYVDLVERVKGTEFERFLPELEDMVEEEREHAEDVRALLEKYRVLDDGP